MRERCVTQCSERSCIALSGQEYRYLTDTGEALRQLIRDIKAGKADHLLAD